MSRAEPVFHETRAHPERDIERWLGEVLVPLCMMIEADPSDGALIETVLDSIMAELTFEA